MTIAAIDYGKRRLGLAAADPSGTIVFPAGVITRSSLKRDLEVIGVRLKELEATQVVIGLPLNMDGTVGTMARGAETFAHHLRESCGLAVELFDERLSTFEARERVKEIATARRRHSRVDDIAAVVILESWLRRRR
jgi:putative Holliday junction resolvase